MEPGQHGSKADVLPWKLAPPFPPLLTLLLLRSTGRVCCVGKTELLRKMIKQHLQEPKCAILCDSTMSHNSLHFFLVKQKNVLVFSLNKQQI